ncbi:MAG: hypothetical protein JWN48_4596 [Myxococcaceae bacterium]|nr:hypothetical protein [Myxococcaceae bacterium]
MVGGVEGSSRHDGKVRGLARHICWRVAASLFSAWLMCVVSAAHAQHERAEPAEYRAVIDRGVEEYQLGNYQEARDEFARAHSMFPNARTLRGLGLTAFELRNYVEAVSTLQSALASKVKPLDANLRANTEEMLARARNYVGDVILQLEPATAVLSVDGIRRTDTPDTLQLDVGDHVLEFNAPGCLTERRAIRVRGGKTEIVKVALAKVSLESSSTHGLAHDAPHDERRPLRKRWWLWTTLGVVSAGAATGVALLLTRQEHTEYRGVGTDRTPRGAAIEALRIR